MAGLKITLALLWVYIWHYLFWRQPSETAVAETAISPPGIHGYINPFGVPIETHNTQQSVTNRVHT